MSALAAAARRPATKQAHLHHDLDPDLDRDLDFVVFIQNFMLRVVVKLYFTGVDKKGSGGPSELDVERGGDCSLGVRPEVRRINNHQCC